MIMNMRSQIALEYSKVKAIKKDHVQDPPYLISADDCQLCKKSHNEPNRKRSASEESSMTLNDEEFMKGPKLARVLVKYINPKL